MYPGEQSRFCDWPRAGLSRDRSLSPGRVNIFLFSTVSKPVLGPIQRGSFSVDEAPGHEVDQSPLSSAEVKDASIYRSTPSFVLMA
jgi:hypothetical protein